LGSNLGDRLVHLRRAYGALDALPGIADLRSSSVYETAPLGMEDQPLFLNLVVSATTKLDAESLLAGVLRIEADVGRRRTVRWGPRVIDIDLLLWGDRTCRSERLELPHPRLAERAFVLVPLRELAPDLRLPDGRAIRELAIDESGVRRVMAADEFVAGL
jgi:2-amino-4-hydroxy-6-hydroxymethyldihydropteridine diphosphokinase